MNGDTLLLADLRCAVDRLWQEGWDGVILARRVEDASRYGQLDVEGGRLVGFREKQAGSGVINGGVYVFRTEWLRQKLEQGSLSFETETLPRLLAEGARIGVIATDAPFIDIGTPETIAEATGFVISHNSAFIGGKM
jgi:D-glycero-alpha-D-manno-heptose 1-phosphate guanylyltransferase